MSRATRTGLLTAAVGSALLALLVGLSPFGLYQYVDLPLLALALTALLLALAVDTRAAEALVGWRVVWAAGVLLAWALFAVAASGRFAAALFGDPKSGLGWLTWTSLAIVVASVSPSHRVVQDRLRAVATWVLLAEGALVAWQAVAGRHPAGTLTNSSYLALVVVLLLPVAVRSALSASPGREWVRWLNAVASLVAAACVLVGDARAAALALAAAGLGWLAWRGVERRGWDRVRAAGAAVGSAVLGLGLAATAAAVALPGVVRAFVSDRALIWAPAARAIAHRPVMGFGPDGYLSAVYPLATAAEARKGLSADPHNLALFVAVSAGLVGVALGCWLLFEVLRNWLRQLRADKGPLEFLPLAVAVLLYGVVVLTTPAALQTLPLFGLVLGASMRVEVRGDRQLPPWVATAFRVLCVSVAVVAVALALTRLSLGRADRSGMSNPRTSAAVASIWRVDPYLYYRASIDAAYAQQRGDTGVAAGADLSAIEKAVRLEPTNPLYQTELARTYAYYRRPEREVRSAFEQALELFPRGADAHAGYAQYLLAAGDLKGATRVLEQGIEGERSPELLQLGYEVFTKAGDTARANVCKQALAAIEADARFRREGGR